MKYGKEPKFLGNLEITWKELMFYQYLPIKMKGVNFEIYEDKLKIFEPLVDLMIQDYIDNHCMQDFIDSYVYLTAKVLFETENNPYNRTGWHSDGFMTDDINYIWCDKDPTIFNRSDFNLTLDDTISLQEMNEQALPENDFVHKPFDILRLDQFNIHKVNQVKNAGVRSFVKLSISKDIYQLRGNAHNYLLDYEWEMKERNITRNMPQSK